MQNGALRKLVSTRSHGRRDRVPSTNQQRRGRMTDATARLKQNAHDAVAWLMWPRGKEKLQMTRPRDPRGRVTEATYQNLQNTPPAISEALLAQIQVQNTQTRGYKVGECIHSEGARQFSLSMI